MIKGLRKHLLQIGLAVGCGVLAVAGFAALNRTETVLTSADMTTQAIQDATMADLEKRDYYIVDIACQKANSRADQIALFLYNNTSRSYSNVDMGYSKEGWRPIEEGADAFLDHIKVDGYKIKDKYKDVKLASMNVGYGIALQGLELKGGEQITIDKGTTLVNGDVKAKMMYDFRITYNGGQDFTVSEVLEYEKVPDREYAIVKTGTVNGYQSSTQLGIKLYDCDTIKGSMVKLGGHEGSWKEIDDKAKEDFLNSVYLNDQPILTACSGVKLYLMETNAGGNNICFDKINVETGDVITIAQEAVLTHELVKAKMQFEFQFTFNGTGYDVVRWYNPPTIVLPDDSEEDNTTENEEDTTEEEDTPENEEGTTTEKEEKPADNSSEEKKGCGSSIGGMGVVAFTLGALALVKKKRK